VTHLHENREMGRFDRQYTGAGTPSNSSMWGRSKVLVEGYHMRSVIGGW